MKSLILVVILFECVGCESLKGKGSSTQTGNRYKSWTICMQPENFLEKEKSRNYSLCSFTLERVGSNTNEPVRICWASENPGYNVASTFGVDCHIFDRAKQILEDRGEPR